MYNKGSISFTEEEVPHNQQPHEWCHFLSIKRNLDRKGQMVRFYAYRYKHGVHCFLWEDLRNRLTTEDKDQLIQDGFTLIDGLYPPKEPEPPKEKLTEKDLEDILNQIEGKDWTINTNDA